MIQAILLTLFGLLLLIRPAAIWALTEQWKSSDATEASKLYLWSTRFGGLICTVVGLVWIFVLLS